MLGRLFSYNRKETTEIDIILTLTPRIVRVLNLTDEDLRAFRLPRDAGAVPELPPLPIPLPLPKPPGDASDAPLLAPAVPVPGQATPVKPPPIKPPK